MTTLLHEAHLDITSPRDARFPDRVIFRAQAAYVMRGLCRRERDTTARRCW